MALEIVTDSQTAPSFASQDCFWRCVHLLKQQSSTHTCIQFTAQTRQYSRQTSKCFNETCVLLKIKLFSHGQNDILRHIEYFLFFVIHSGLLCRSLHDVRYNYGCDRQNNTSSVCKMSSYSCSEPQMCWVFHLCKYAMCWNIILFGANHNVSLVI